MAEKEKKPIKIAPETQRLNWYVNSLSPPNPPLPAVDGQLARPQPHSVVRLGACHTRLTHSSRKLNTSPASLDEKDVLKKPLCTPMVRRIDLHFPLGLEVTARNLKGVTIKDALDAIYKQFKKKVRSVPFSLPACERQCVAASSYPRPTPASPGDSG